MQFIKSASLVSVVVLAAAAVACSSGGGTTPTTDAAVTDAKKDAIGTTDSGGTDGGGGSCKPGDSSGFTASPATPPALAAGACAAADVTNFFDWCITPGDTTKCTAFTKDTTKAACNKCLIGPETAAKGTALLLDDQNLIRNNIGGCLLAKGDKTCADAQQAVGDCTRFVCPDSICPVPDGDKAALNALNKCLSDAQKTTCKTYADKATCINGDAASVAACTADANSTDGFRDTYVKVATVICVNGG
jgi:hypothetical protein